MASTNAGEFKNLDVEMQKTPVNRGVLSLLNSSKQVQNGLPITFSTVTGFISDDLPVIGIQEIWEGFSGRIATTMKQTIQDILEIFRAEAASNRDLGDKFERLIAAYLTKDPYFAEHFSDVWLWMEWPGRANKPDTGIDLVAQERATGDLTAIQCKFLEPTHTLQKEDIDSFSPLPAFPRPLATWVPFPPGEVLKTQKGGSVLI